MSQDRVQDLSPSDLPEPVGEWLAEVAAERGIDEEELLSRLLAVTGESGVIDVEEERLDDLEDRLAEIEERTEEVETLADRVDQLSTRTDELDAELEEKIGDVRERVIQVKREADGKAPREHDHPDLAERIDDLADELETVADSVDDLEEHIEEGAGGSEAVQEELRAEVEEVTSDMRHKLNVLASAVLDIRDRVSELDVERSKRVVVDRLRQSANQNGVETAECESCGESIDISLLSEPACPHCEEALRSLDPKHGFFGSNVLRTGTPPALEGEVTEEDLTELDLE